MKAYTSGSPQGFFFFPRSNRGLFFFLLDQIVHKLNAKQNMHTIHKRKTHTHSSKVSPFCTALVKKDKKKKRQLKLGDASGTSDRLGVAFQYQIKKQI